MSLSLALTAGVLAACATVVWRKWVRTLPREKGFEELLESARRQLDTPSTFRPLRGANGKWADVLNAAMLQMADRAPAFVQAADIVVACDERIEAAIRPFVSSDGKSVLFVTCLESVPPFVGFASYTSEARYVTVRAQTWPSRSPISHVRCVAADASFAELLHAHVAHVPAEELVAVSSTEDFLQQLVRMERLDLEWRRAQPEEVLFEHDLKVLLGDRYDELHGLMDGRSSSQIPRARAASRDRVR